MMFLLVLLAASHGAFGGEWKASVVQNIDALVSSCVVLPCSFSHPKEPLPTSRLRGIWHRSSQWDQRIYHNDNTKVLENFRGRTRLLGQLGQGNCSLEITPIQDSDYGSFCFRIELARTGGDAATPDQFSFHEDCVTLKMLSDPPKPTLSHGNAAIQGRPYVVSCSVRHTCPTHAPTLTWSRGTPLDVTTINREVHLGFWEVQSILTIVPEATDDHADVTCTARFYSRRTTSDTFTLFVKRRESYDHIIIPTIAVLGTILIFSGVCMLMVKKYKGRIAELQNQDSVWSRMSRMSRRIQSTHLQPVSANPRRPREESEVALNNLPSSSRCKVGPKFCKPFMPAPGSLPKDNIYIEDLSDADDYENTAGLSVHRNC
ncbi:myelin-associated glycoprotein-like isoform X2 [Entelurus aequoreus]|uniref:myelin-associated glycoprotein-like isoform X2 n=1 Tax=Entelurus aequoreus TaxID=161455 RepID=UPI002B1E42D5|nr:myelin-associated glycoprotein-like isoform X2 [Entelurus aequoreus]